MATVSTHAFRRHEVATTPLWAASDPARPIMYGIVLPGDHVPGGVPIVKGGDVENVRLLPPLLSRTTAAIDAAYARARLRRGDVLVTIRGSYGASAVVPPELEGANITQDTARVAPRPSSADGQWLWLMLCSAQVRDELALVATGATIKGVNIRDLKRIRVPIPSLGTQRSEVAAAMASLGRLRTAQETAERLTHALTAYRSSLIHEAVTGKLDVTKASERQMDERLHAAAEGRLDEVPV
jgi:type I restriction enzyme S subunit